MFSFQGTSLNLLRDSVKPQLALELQSISLISLFEVVGQGLAFLRESHGGCNSPPDCCQEPPFESILASSPLELNRFGLDSYSNYI